MLHFRRKEYESLCHGFLVAAGNMDEFQRLRTMAGLFFQQIYQFVSHSIHWPAPGDYRYIAEKSHDTVFVDLSKVDSL